MILIKNVFLNYSKKECRYLLNSTLMVHTWRKLSIISPQKSDREKNICHILIKIMLRDPSFKKNPEVIICTLSFIPIYLSFLDIWKECLMREHTKQQ